MAARHRRRRVLIALLAILGLLFQQVAVAAYACTQAAPAPSTAHCARMAMDAATVNPALCSKHCTPDPSTSPDAPADVAMLAPPPMLFALATAPATGAAATTAVSPHRSDPPARLRFCSLQI